MAWGVGGGGKRDEGATDAFRGNRMIVCFINVVSKQSYAGDSLSLSLPCRRHLAIRAAPFPNNMQIM